MSLKVRLVSPAKINLFLHILGQNPNGYHELQTIFQLINWYDKLEFEKTQDGKIELISPSTSFPPEENLIYKAALLLQKKYPSSFGCKIFLEKNIPIGAGLGGGSSNAGITLRALNELWDINTNEKELLEIATQLGADVPVFTLNHSAWAEGIGENLTPIKLAKQFYLVLYPNVFINTKKMFDHIDLKRNTKKIKLAEYSFETTHNDFQNLALDLYPEVKEAFNWLKQFGTPRLSGSGSSMFLAVKNEKEGEIIQNQAPQKWQIRICQSL